MNNMKRLFYIFITAVGLSVSFNSCTDILDTAPYSSAASSTMWTTENLTDLGVAGIYGNMRNMAFVNGASGYGYFGFDQWGYTGQARSSEPIIAGTITVGNGLFSLYWKRMYEGIHRANDAIANIPTKSPISAEKKGRLVAECKFLRAYYYYRLNELYKGVPVYLEPIDESECTKTQSTETEVWEVIIKDLTDCINEPNLPNIDLTGGRVTKGAAYTLRGKIYLFQKKWDLAAADFAKVGECGYSLFQGGYKELFTQANERCAEMIFSVQNYDEVGFGGNSQFYCGGRSAFGSCWNTFLPSPCGVDLYENKDGSPFNWDDVIPGYSTMNANDREIFFLRDTVGTYQQILSLFPTNPTLADTRAKAVRAAVDTRLKALASVKDKYLPSGNEARIRKAYTNRDPRLEMNVITPYAKWNGVIGLGSAAQISTLRWPFVNQDIEDNWTDSRSQCFYLYRKFVYEGDAPLTTRERCPTDEPIFRYADVLLMWAEALVEQNKLAEAAEKVNLVRARKTVEMPAVKYANQADLREKVRNERRVEFLNEGVNFFDEMRWGTFKENKFKAGNGILHMWGGVVASAYVWPTGNDLNIWPVPSGETEKNKNLKQTPGWIY